MKLFRLGTLALIAVCAPAWLGAEVVDSSAAGFTIRQTVSIKADPTEVYHRVLRVGEWWSPEHTFSGDAHNMSMEEKAGGCFCEKMPAGGVKHMEVTFFSPGKQLVLQGALGPLKSLAANGTMEMKFTAEEGGTKLEVTYAVGGYLPAGMNSWAAPVDGVLKAQVTRLKNWVEHGDPGK